MKKFPMFLPLAAIMFITVFGCEAGRERAVTGDFFDRKAGKLDQAAAIFDSLKGFGGDISSPSNALAGTYGTTSAFAVFAFNKPASTVLEGLKKVRVNFYVYGVWVDGVRSFGLYSTTTDWTDTTRLDRDRFLGGLGAPLATWSETVTTVSAMTFELGSEAVDLVRSWSTSGAFLLKEAPGARAMANVYTAFSSSAPTIDYISLISGVSDTTRIKSSSSNYAFDTGYGGLVSDHNGVVSDGNRGGFVLYLSLPDSFPRTNIVNGGTLVLPIVRNDIPSGLNMNIKVTMLTDVFTRIADAKTSSDQTSDHLIKSTDNKISIDITGMLNTLTISPALNYGILFKSLTAGSSPAQIVLALPDSIGITFTTIPEVK